MNDEEQVPQVRTPEALADAGETPVGKLEALGVRGILWQLARDGQLIDVRCEMPQCYSFRGRSYFEPRSTLSEWSPTADHYPRLKMHGGHDMKRPSHCDHVRGYLRAGRERAVRTAVAVRPGRR